MSICCTSAGGTLRLTLGGVVYPVRGNVSIMPTKFEVSEGANLDGSVYTTRKPVPATVEMTISDSCGLSLTTLANQACVDATVELDSVGRTYVLVNGTVVGRPSLDPETGEISGVKLVATDVRELNVAV